jgi:hypothetical protein
MDVVLQVKRATTEFVRAAPMDDQVVTVFVVLQVNLVSTGSASLNVLPDSQCAVMDVAPIHKHVVTVFAAQQVKRALMEPVLVVRLDKQLAVLAAVPPDSVVTGFAVQGSRNV